MVKAGEIIETGNTNELNMKIREWDVEVAGHSHHTRRACGLSELNLRELLSPGLKVMYFQADVTFKTDLNITPTLEQEYFLFLSQPDPSY